MICCAGRPMETHGDSHGVFTLMERSVIRKHGWVRSRFETRFGVAPSGAQVSLAPAGFLRGLPLGHSLAGSLTVLGTG